MNCKEFEKLIPDFFEQHVKKSQTQSAQAKADDDIQRRMHAQIHPADEHEEQNHKGRSFYGFVFKPQADAAHGGGDAGGVAAGEGLEGVLLEAVGLHEPFGA